ncbi:hypothetical protein EVAR_50547_1 [Eumeta japonica]|uniref:Uncharacterized protein n=1 Tax=Eumeta variegata TaxID=151549 RepID=A0A4C1YR69_EUMVA|nr:hypothetical protein EVAR_50547_1 [Eumeta japonica]
MQTGDRGISVFSNNKLPMSIQVASAVVQPQDIARRGAPEHVVPTPLLRPVLGNSRVFKVFGCQEEVRARVGRAHNGVALFVSRPRLLVGREAGGGGTEVPLKAKRRRTGIANLTANDIRLAEQCSRLIMATPIDMLILALEATQDPRPGPSGADIGEDIQDHGVPRPAPTQAPPREALHPASAAVASDCSGETRAAKVVAPSDDRNTIEDPLPSLAKNGQKSRVNSETTNDLEPGDYSSSGSSWAPDQQSSSDSESEKGKKQPRLKPALSTRRTPNRLLKKVLERQTYDLGRKDASNSNLFQKYAKCSTLRKTDDKGKINIAKIKMNLIASSEISEIKDEVKIIKETVQKLKTLSSNLMTTLLGAGKESCKSQSPDFPAYNVEGVAFDTLHGGDEKSVNELNQGTPPDYRSDTRQIS